MALSLLLAGVLAALALPPIYAFPILPFALTFLYIAASQAPNIKWAALWGFLFGMGFHIAGLYWLTNAILTRAEDFWWVVPFAAPGVACIISPLIMVPAVLCRFVPKGCPRIFVFAGAWTLADMSRSLIFSGFPWNPIGSALEVPGCIGNILIQPASYLGVNGVGLAIVTASLAVWHGRRAITFVCIGVVIWCGFGIWRLNYLEALPIVNPYIVLVQGNMSEDNILGQSDAVHSFHSYLRQTVEGVKSAQFEAHGRSIVVVWPESAFPGILDENERARQLIAEAAQGASVLVGSDRRSGGRWYNSLEAIGSNGSLQAIYDKSRLVPFGEYQPWIIPFNILPVVLTPGDGLKTWDFPQVGRVGPMVCYEIIFSGGVVARGERPNWLVTISNDAWYGNSAGPRQHLATGRMRAVEEGLPVVFANNRGISAIYDAFGREKKRTEWGKDQYITLSIPSPLPMTFFAYIHNWSVIVLSFIFIIVPFFITRRFRLS